MFRSCPATGRLSHSFDKVTHQCKCGRWERGFKPKCGPVSPRAECQICERTQALTPYGRLFNHGYKRPGWGWIVGTCPGSDHLPYTATNALIRYLGAVKNHIQGCKDKLANVPTIELYEHPYQFFNPETKKREPRVHTIIRGDVSHYNLECRGFFPSFDQCAAKLTGRLHAEIGNATSEQLRVEARITHACEL